MIVGIDTRPLQNQSASRGIGMYTRGLVDALRREDDVTVIELTEGEMPKHMDIIHYPWFDLFYPTLPFRKRRPSVVTIHDVTPLVLPEFYPAGMRGRFNLWRQRMALRSVRAVITDSDASASDITAYLNVPPEEVYPIHLAPQGGFPEHVSTELMNQVREKYGVPSKYILYVGDVNRNKNVLGLVEACRQVGVPLLIVGKQAVTEDFDREHPENLDLADLQQLAKNSDMVKLLGFVETDELAALYARASAYCQPSFYEGFGLPILEAMSCGCPVICTKVASLPEIGGEAVIYADPEPGSLGKAIGFVLNLPESGRLRLIKEGRTQAKKFTWEKTARETVEVYERVLRESGR